VTKKPPIRSVVLTLAVLIVSTIAWIDFAPTSVGGDSAYVITHGISMEPRFHTGDLAIVHPAARYTVGEIVAYHSSLLHVTVLHRIVAIRDGRYTFKGDNNDFLDPVHPTRAQLLGKLWLHIKGGGRYLEALHNPLVAAVLAGIAGLILMGAVGVKSRGPRARRQRRVEAVRRQSTALARGKETHMSDSSNLRTLLAVAGAATILFLMATLVGFTQPTSHPASRSIPYTQHTDFSYAASVPAGPVYPSGRLTTGAPIFTDLVHRLAIGLHYRMAAPDSQGLRGTEQIALWLSAPSGWKRVISLTPVRMFRGDSFTAGVWLNLAQVTKLLAAVQQATGIPSDNDSVAVRASIRVGGRLGGRVLSARFTPQLAFSLNAAQLLPGSGGTGSSGPTGLHVTATGGIPIPATKANRIDVFGVALGIPMLRFLGPVGFIITLIITALLAALVVRGRSFGESEQIRAKYGHIIVPITAGADLGWPAIDVASIKALAQLAEASGQLILHNHGDDADTYLVNDEGSVYRYQVQLPKVVWGEWSEPATQLADAADLSRAAQTLGDVAAGAAADA